MRRERLINVGQRAYCPHCDNQGLVEPCRPGRMGEHAPFGAPCPMCLQGILFERTVFGSEDAYWTRERLESSSWDRGYTFRHDRRCRFAREGDEWSCGRPASGAYCDFHALESNRLPGGAGSVSGLLKASGF